MITPAYIVMEERLLRNYQSMCERMKPCRIAYSMKANPCRSVARILSRTNAGFEICSLFEAKILREEGVDPDRMHCGMVVMTESEIVDIYRTGCRIFTFDTKEQLHRIKVCSNNDVKTILRVRINDLSVGSIGYGMPIEEIDAEPEIIKQANGLSFHISDHRSMEVTLQAIERIEHLLSNNKNISLINIGGSYSLAKADEDYALLRTRLETIRQQYAISILCEPGAAIVDSAVDALVTCVLVQNQNGFYDVFLDGGITCGMVRAPKMIRNLTECRPSKRSIYRFFDTTSMKRLLFQTRLEMELQNGDLLLLRNYGAYSYCYSNIFHSRPLPAVYEMKEGDTIESLVQRVSV